MISIWEITLSKLSAMTSTKIFKIILAILRLDLRTRGYLLLPLSHIFFFKTSIVDVGFAFDFEIVQSKSNGLYSGFGF